MAFSSFDGPILSGTQKFGAQTSAAGVNTGSVELIQSGDLPAAAGATTIAVLPAGSRITEFLVDTTTVFNAATTLTIGDGTTADKYVGATTTITNAGRLALTTTMNYANMANVGTSPVRIVATTAGAAATGAARITVRYIQRDSAGNARPTKA